MEHYKISKLLDDLTVLKFVKRRWIELNDLSNGQCSFNKNIWFKTTILKSNLSYYVYIIVKVRISFTDTNKTNRRNKKLTFNNNDPFLSCI